MTYSPEQYTVYYTPYNDTCTSSDEFYDKNVLSSFISALKDNHWLDSEDDGSLKYSEECEALREDVMALIWPEMMQHLENVALHSDKD